MGALLAMRLAAHHPVRGLILMAPAIAQGDLRTALAFLGRYALGWRPPAHKKGDAVDPEALKRMWSYSTVPLRTAFQVYRLQKEVLPLLGHISVPTLIFQGRHDRTISTDAGRLAYEAIAASDKELVLLEHSGHVLTVDADREFVWRKTAEWMMAWASGRISAAQ